MNRTIKFRAWDKLHKKMLTRIDVMHFDSSESGIEQVYGYNPSKEATSDANWVALESLEVMQFTGLLDRNSKEIYDGDIVKYNNGAFKQVDFMYFIHECIEYGETEFVSCEIIGNIYENKELLEDSNEH